MAYDQVLKLERHWKNFTEGKNITRLITGTQWDIDLDLLEVLGRPSTSLPWLGLIAKQNQVELKVHNFFKLPSFPDLWARL